MAQYYNRAKNASMRGKRPPLPTDASSQKPGTCTTKQYNHDGTHQERKKVEHRNNNGPYHVEPASLLLPPSSRIHRADSRVQIHQATIHVQPSTASIELVSHHQGDLQQGLDYFEKRDMIHATTAFKHASDSQVPVGMLLYGLALYHGWVCKEKTLVHCRLIMHFIFGIYTQGCEACMPRGVKHVQQAIEYHVDIKCLTSTSTIMRAKIAMAMQALGILFRAGGGQVSHRQIIYLLMAHQQYCYSFLNKWILQTHCSGWLNNLIPHRILLVVVVVTFVRAWVVVVRVVAIVIILLLVA